MWKSFASHIWITRHLKCKCLRLGLTFIYFYPIISDQVEEHPQHSMCCKQLSDCVVFRYGHEPNTSAYFFSKPNPTILLECINFHTYESKHPSVDSIRREMGCRGIRQLNNSSTHLKGKHTSKPGRHQGCCHWLVSSHHLARVWKAGTKYTVQQENPQ